MQTDMIVVITKKNNKFTAIDNLDMNRIFFTSLIVLFSFVQNSYAQWNNRYRFNPSSLWEIGISAGVSTFMTSINPEAGSENRYTNYWTPQINPGFGLAIKYNIIPSLGVEVNYLNTRLTGTWSNEYPTHPSSGGHDSPLTFDSKINQFDLLATFNLNQLILPDDDPEFWHVYVKTGPGLSQIIDKEKFYADKDSFNYKRFSYSVDAGASFTISESVKILFGTNFRLVNSDNLDGLHIFDYDNEGNVSKAYFHVSEIYNFTYLRVNYCFGTIGKQSYYRPRYKRHKRF